MNILLSKRNYSVDKKEVPDIKFYIVGSNPTQKIRRI